MSNVKKIHKIINSSDIHLIKSDKRTYDSYNSEYDIEYGKIRPREIYMGSTIKS